MPVLCPLRLYVMQLIVSSCPLGNRTCVTWLSGKTARYLAAVVSTSSGPHRRTRTVFLGKHPPCFGPLL